MEYLRLIVGFILLIKGADWFVVGSSGVAKLLKIPSIVIGLTVVAFGTSMPEASVSINAAIQGDNSIAISNVIGSDIFNLLCVLGMSALLCPVCCDRTAVKKEMPLSIIFAAALGLLLIPGTVLPGSAETALSERLNAASFTLGRIDGVILLLIFAYYLYSQIHSALKVRMETSEAGDDSADAGKNNIWMLLFRIVIGLAGIIYGGNLVVENASVIAQNFGMSQTFIGLTIVAIGTSLPELVTSMVAAHKGESDLALGNVVGSNIFNIIFILGFSALISPMTIDIASLYDTAILIVVSLLATVLMARRMKVTRLQGALYLLIYVLYFIYILLR